MSANKGPQDHSTAMFRRLQVTFTNPNHHVSSLLSMCGLSSSTMSSVVVQRWIRS